MADSRRARLTVVLCWHMHQPEYRAPDTGEYLLPWTLLHALKDYSDMAAHLEAEPAARAVVNFAPVLLEQITDLAARLRDWCAHRAPMGEPLLDALAGTLPRLPSERAALIRQCLRVNARRVIERFPPYARLAGIAARIGEDADLAYLGEQYLVDLLVWYVLGWMGEGVRRSDARVQALQHKGGGFTSADCASLLVLISELLGALLGRYRALAAGGRIELSMSPYTHPILPLLLDAGAGRESQPATAPIEPYPGGRARAHWQLRHGREVFRRHLQVEPLGCWPSEGALSAATIELLAEEGFRWCASGEGVLRNSLAFSQAERATDCRHRAWRLGELPVDCFFRDDGLSDLIGFTYSEWHADDAVANLVHHMEQIAGQCPDRHNCVLAVILDGENAWEHYPENAWHFLGALYRRLAHHSRLALGTFGSYLERHRPEPARLERLVAGSWVHGTLSTWAGIPDKNRGWVLLAEAKRVFDRAHQLLADETTRERAERVLAVCEGSDWFWWFGDYNPADSVADFERLYRAHLAGLYRALGEPVPEVLSVPFCAGGGDPALGGVMRLAGTAQ